MKLPIGYDDFSEIVDKKLDFVDKTLFIREIIEDIATKVIVITRPRRFGKTLNLSMLHYFFVAEAYGRKTQGLFDGLKIAELGEEYLQHQGQYPVIFLTLKDVKENTFSTAYANLINVLHRLYRDHHYLLNSPQLAQEEKETFCAILEQRASTENVKSALLDLSYYLFKHHGKKVWLLIDEYDTPIQTAYLRDYYPEMIDFIRGLFGAVLKTNPYLEKAVITGILRIAKESLFSGLNNVKVYTLLNSEYSEYFGFTEDEVAQLLAQAKLESQANDIRHWYNGYLVGNTVIYNPWSIASCVNEGGALCPYWVNTSGNELVHKLLAWGDASLKNDLTRLLKGQAISASVDEYIVFSDLEKDNHALWSLLLFSGYLKVVRSERVRFRLECELIPPNHEVKLLYEDTIQGWFDRPLGHQNYQNFLNSLIRGNVEEFTERLQDCLLDNLSFFDVSGHHPEKFYHGFVLGLVVSLENTHEVRSNQESGYGRYDVMLIPKDRTQLGIVMEFKTVKDKNIALPEAAQDALQQTLNRHYAQELHRLGIQHILHLGLAFRGKHVAVVAG